MADLHADTTKKATVSDSVISAFSLAFEEGFYQDLVVDQK